MQANRLATTLVDLPGDLNQGSVVSLEVQKKGVVRGPSTARVIYGDDLVHVILWSGFSYKALVARSEAKLDVWLAKNNRVLHDLHAEAQELCPDVSMDDVCIGLQEVQDSFRRAQGTGEADAPPSGIWEPYRVEGKVIPGARVYVGSGDLLDPRAPVKGTVYLTGIKLGEQVLEPAANGPWKMKNRPKTVVKDLIRSKLPVSLFASYCLEPERMRSLRVGKAASVAARGVPVNLEAVRLAFKVSP
jgi:hypothetical protein